MVRIVCTDESGNSSTMSIDAESLVEDLHVLIEVEFGIPVMEQQIIAANGAVLQSGLALAAQGIDQDTSVTVRRLQRQQKQSQSEVKFQPHRTLALAEANTLIEEIFKSGVKRKSEPLFNEADPEVQRRIYDKIYWDNVNENLKTAHEFTPEVFVGVHMLFVNCEINRVKVKAFIDSGAQVSIINVRTATQCELMRLLDTRAAVVMRGVGVRRSLGRIHMAVVNLGGLHIPFSLNVIDDDQMDLIIGLDQLKRHRMLIDLKDNCLRIEGVMIPFLSESEVPPLMNGPEVEEDIAALERNEDKSVNQRPPVITSATMATTKKTGSESEGAKVPAAISMAPSDTQTAPAQSLEFDTSDSRMNEEECILALMTVTGADREKAIMLLRAADWNVSLAAAFFFGG